VKEGLVDQLEKLIREKAAAKAKQMEGLIAKA
jgi:hypothetical protein